MPIRQAGHAAKKILGPAGILNLIFVLCLFSIGSNPGEVSHGQQTERNPQENQVLAL
jgi:hypothetical protein